MGDSAADDAILDAWRAYDERRAVLPADVREIEATRALRALIVEAIRAKHPGRDLFQACADLGRHLAEHGASPTLAACTLDGARAALADAVAPWETMRAALGEGYSAGQRDLARREAMDAWSYPRCVVRLDAQTIAIAAGYPFEDGEALATWSDRLAHAAAMDGVRRAVLDESGAAHDALRSALETAGIHVDLRGEHDAASKAARRFRLWPLSWGRSAGRGHAKS